MSSYVGPASSALVPDADTIGRFVSWWFHHCMEGKIEIGWMDPVKGGLHHFRLFEIGDEELISEACRINSVPGQSVYVRASTVNPKVYGKTVDADFVQSPGCWGDLDTFDQVERAKAVQTLVRPNGSIITGNVPHLRVQTFFRTEEPITDGAMVRSLNSRVLALYGGDSAVVNPTRLMRLPGTIAWPWKKDRIPELTAFALPNDNRLAAYPIAMLTSQLPQEAAKGAASSTEGMRATLNVSAERIRLIQSGENWHDNVVSLTASLVHKGVSNAEILAMAPGFTLDGYTLEQTRAEMAKAIEGARTKWNRPEADEAATEAKAEQTRRTTRMLSLAQLKALPPPQWLIEGLVPEKALVVPFGPPKKGKTFIVLSQGLHVAAGLDWMGRATMQGGVVYIAGEGIGGLGLRVAAMQLHYGISDDVPFWVIPGAINFADPAAVTGLIKLVRDTVLDEPIVLVVVDTLARAMPGVDENSSQEVGVVIAACDLIKTEMECTVMPIHHAGKDATKGLRGSSAIHGAVDASFQINGTGKMVTLTPTDQKDADPGPPMVFEMLEIAAGIGRTSLVPVLANDGTPHEEEGRSTPRFSANESLALRALVNALAEHGRMDRTGAIPDGCPVCTDAEWREAFRNLKAGEDRESVRRTFSRVSTQLITRKIVGCKVPYVWEVRITNDMQ